MNGEGEDCGNRERQRRGIVSVGWGGVGWDGVGWGGVG